MPKRVLPFTWGQFEKEIGQALPGDIKRRLDRCVRDPERWWTTDRSIVVAPHMSIMGQTLWQCVQAVGLAAYADGPRTDTVSQPAARIPSQEMIILALCYAAGIPRAG